MSDLKEVPTEDIVAELFRRFHVRSYTEVRNTKGFGWTVVATKHTLEIIRNPSRLVLDTDTRSTPTEP